MLKIECCICGETLRIDSVWVDKFYGSEEVKMYDVCSECDKGGRR